MGVVATMETNRMPKPVTATGIQPGHWPRTLRISAALLGVWLAVTLAATWLPTLSGQRFFGWPLGFWVASQGALLTYCAIVWVYAVLMNRADRAQGGTD